ncbi:uncharacterized protein CMU_017490 [Cryptosporidium muris RN66]|uniref:Uncharacterized protein n=1 Tax=Cryptosporidium muris (strain RN66) TaxID=441375 RepID=B6ACZ2_CRYMR|nr:uncharacterized protein CMU_017490 [Cryptosporidium muris RN66]EEA05996.1 hypothetical protein, conserved [Cryptosporidium muris RN66]|eukprot:XP_002140345.1 hypothetical protein [Cryptosporidium muris RN66]
MLVHCISGLNSEVLDTVSFRGRQGEVDEKSPNQMSQNLNNTKINTERLVQPFSLEIIQNWLHNNLLTSKVKDTFDHLTNAVSSWKNILHLSNNSSEVVGKQEITSDNILNSNKEVILDIQTPNTISKMKGVNTTNTTLGMIIDQAFQDVLYHDVDRSNLIGIIKSDNTSTMNVNSLAWEMANTQNIVGANSAVIILENYPTNHVAAKNLLLKALRPNIDIFSIIISANKVMRNLLQQGELSDKRHDKSLDELEKKINSGEIEMRSKSGLPNSSKTQKKPWYEPLKELGICLLNNKKTIFDAVIYIIEMSLGSTPIGLVVVTVVRVISAIISLIYDMVQKRRGNSNLIRVLRNLDNVKATYSAKASLGSKLIETVASNMQSISDSQFRLALMFDSITELAEQVQQSEMKTETQVIQRKLESVINSTYSVIDNNTNHTILNESFLRRLNSIDNMEAYVGVSIKDHSFYSKAADKLENLAKEIYKLHWDNPYKVRILSNSSEKSSLANKNQEVSYSKESNPPLTTGSKEKWYDGLIAFANSATVTDGVPAVLDMLIDLFGTIFKGSSIGPPVLAVIKVVGYLVETLIKVFAQTSAKRQLIQVSRTIPEKIIGNNNYIDHVLQSITNLNDQIKVELLRINKYIRQLKIEDDNIDLHLGNEDWDLEDVLNFQGSLDMAILNNKELASMEYRQNSVTENHFSNSRSLSESSLYLLNQSEFEFHDFLSKIGNFFEGTFDKIRDIVRNIFTKLFHGEKLLNFIEEFIHLTIELVKAIYNVIRNKSTQRLLLHSIELSDDPTLHSILESELYKTVTVGQDMSAFNFIM